MDEPKGIFFDTLPSTQDWVKAHTVSLPHFSWVQALAQTKGRGRRGNAWASPPGSLYLTLWLPLPSEDVLTWMPLAFSLWISDYVEKNFGLNLQVKWPNDLWLQDKKCGGLLCERISSGFMVGIGLNFQNPEGVLQASSIATALKASDMQDLGSKIALYLIECYQGIPNPQLWRKQYEERAVFRLGDLISYKEADASRQARVLGLGENATLRVESQGKERELFAADVSLLRKRCDRECS